MFGIKTLIKKLEELNKKIDAQHDVVDSRLYDIEKVQLAQEINLKEHMKRSENLEKLISHLEENDIKPVVRHVSMVEGALKLLGVIGILTTIIGGVLKIFGIV